MALGRLLKQTEKSHSSVSPYVIKGSDRISVQWYLIIFCQIATVVNGGRNFSTWRKPPPNPKSLNNGHDGNGEVDGS